MASCGRCKVVFGSTDSNREGRKCRKCGWRSCQSCVSKHKGCMQCLVIEKVAEDPFLAYLQALYQATIHLINLRGDWIIKQQKKADKLRKKQAKADQTKCDVVTKLIIFDDVKSLENKLFFDVTGNVSAVLILIVPREEEDEITINHPGQADSWSRILGSH